MKPFSEKGLLDLSRWVSEHLVSIATVDLHHDTSNVSYPLSKTPETESNHIRPRLVFDAEDELDDETKEEEGGKEGIGFQARRVPIESSLDRTFGSDLGARIRSGRGDDHGVRGRWQSSTARSDDVPRMIR
jgi:hypothetical protein